MARRGSGIKFTVEGIERIKQAFNEKPELLARAAAVAIYSEALALDELINRNNMVPVKTGRLRESHYVTVPTETNPISEIGYGAPYAAEVHERGADRTGGSFDYKGRLSLQRDAFAGHHGRGTPGWMRKAIMMWAVSGAARIRRAFADALQKGTTVQVLVSAGVPTSPHDPGRLMYTDQDEMGYRKQGDALRKLARQKVGLQLVGKGKHKKTTGLGRASYEQRKLGEVTGVVVDSETGKARSRDYQAWKAEQEAEKVAKQQAREERRRLRRQRRTEKQRRRRAAARKKAVTRLKKYTKRAAKSLGFNKRRRRRKAA